MLIHLYDSSSAGLWINPITAWWFGIKNNSGDWLTMICTGDPDSTNETTVLWFGSIHSSQGAAESALDTLVSTVNSGEHAQFAPYIRFDTSQSTRLEGTVTVRYISTRLVYDLAASNVVMINANRFPQFSGTQTYSTNAAANAAADDFADDINDLLA